MAKSKKKKAKAKNKSDRKAPPRLPWADGDPVLRPPKQAISLRVDRDVLDHFRAGGPGYQSRMNAVLRAWMKAQTDGGSR